MEAAIINGYGRDVEIKDVPMPMPGPNDVVIRVVAAAVNPVDWKIRDGMLRLLTGRRFPKILGSECAGEVVETGSNAPRFRKGDPVIGYPGIRRLAAYAEYVSVPERTTFPKPAGITFEQASTLPIAGLTALQALRDLGHIAAGHEVLINGAAGGVGHFAVQIARILGAGVTAVCSDAKAPLVQGLGADRVIDYTREDFTPTPPGATTSSSTPCRSAPSPTVNECWPPMAGTSTPSLLSLFSPTSICSAY